LVSGTEKDPVFVAEPVTPPVTLEARLDVEPLPVTLETRPDVEPLPVTLETRPDVEPLPVKLETRPDVEPLPVRLETRPDVEPLPVKLETRPDVEPLPVRAPVRSDVASLVAILASEASSLLVSPERRAPTPDLAKEPEAEPNPISLRAELKAAVASLEAVFVRAFSSAAVSPVAKLFIVAEARDLAADELKPESLSCATSTDVASFVAALVAILVRDDSSLLVFPERTAPTPAFANEPEDEPTPVLLRAEANISVAPLVVDFDNAVSRELIFPVDNPLTADLARDLAADELIPEA